MKKLLLFTLCCLVMTTFGQTQINGSINMSNVPRTTYVGQFSGFNNGPYLYSLPFGANVKVWDLNAGTAVNTTFNGDIDPRFITMNNELQPVLNRFPGGVGNGYHRYGAGYGTWKGVKFSDPYFFATNPIYNIYTKLASPAPATSNNNVIFPIINEFTNNHTVTAKSNFVLNLMEHYRAYVLNGVTYNPRAYTFNNISSFENVTTYGNLPSVTADQIQFKAIVRENLDAIKTLLDNGVSVPNIEFGNEHFFNWYLPSTANSNANGNYTYSQFVNNTNFVTITSNTPTNNPPFTINSAPANSCNEKMWYYVTNQPNNVDMLASLHVYAALCKMYRMIIINEFPSQNFKFGIPIVPTISGTTQQLTYWSNYFILQTTKNYINNEAYIVHEYDDVTPTLNTTNPNLYFPQYRDNMENWFTTNTKGAILNYLQNIPANSEVWLTEWETLPPANHTSALDYFFNIAYIKDCNNTFLHAAYYSDYLLSIIENNVLPTTKNLYTVANHHTYNGIKGAGASCNLFDVQYSLNSSTTLYKRAAFYAHKLMLPVINNVNQYKYINLSNAGFATNAHTKFTAFYKEPDPLNTSDGGELLLYFKNTSGTNYSINLSNYAQSLVGNNWYLIDVVNSKKYIMWSDSLQASRGQTNWNGLTEITAGNQTDPTKTIQFDDPNPVWADKGNTEVSITAANATNYILPKYSLGYFKLKINIVPNCVGSNCLGRKSNPKNNIDNFNVDIFPNPVVNELSFKLYSPNDGNANVQIFDINGKLVSSDKISFPSGITNSMLDVSSLPSATYIVKIISNETTISKKIEVIK
jgi:hypothetical protein